MKDFCKTGDLFIFNEEMFIKFINKTKSSFTYYNFRNYGFDGERGFLKRSWRRESLESMVRLGTLRPPKIKERIKFLLRTSK